MTILESYAHRLVVQVKSGWQDWLLVVFCWGIGLWAVFNAATITFTCQRVESREGYCGLTTTRALGSATQRINLDRISAANIVASTTTDSHGEKRTNYQVLLQTISGRVFIVDGSNLDEQQQWADQINAFLSDVAQREFTLSRDGRWVPYALGAVCLGLGFWLAFFTFCVTTYVFDRTAGTLAIEQRLVVHWTTEYPLDDIHDLEVRLRENRKKDRPDSRWLCFGLKSGRSIATNLPGDDDLIQSIRLFLGIDRIPG